MTADGGWIDVTAVAGDLLCLARCTAAQPPSGHAVPGHGCPSSWTALCRHLGHCDGGCLASRDAPVQGAPAAGDAPCKLTGRESEVVAHVRQGFTNKEIARRLGIQEDTVKKHLQAAFGKLGVRRRALLAFARPMTA